MLKYIEATAVDAEDLHCRLQTLAILATVSHEPPRSKKLRTCNNFRIPAALSSPASASQSLETLPKPRIRLHPSLTQLANKKRS